MKESIATIQAIQPTDNHSKKLDIGGGMTLELVDVTFSVEAAAEDMTPVIFKEPHKVRGVSSETRLWQHDGNDTPGYQLNRGTFVATLNRHPGLAVGKQFVVVLPDDSE